MGRAGDHDEEAANANPELRSLEPYHDDEDNDADVSSPDAPLHPPRPSTEFDDAPSAPKSSWYAQASSRVPNRFKKAWRATVRWVKGPDSPRPFSITPIFPNIQHTPIDLLERHAPRSLHKAWLLALLYVGWLLSFSLVQWSSNAAAEVPGYGSPARLSCSTRYWRDDNDCGLNGDRCRPFSNSSIAFRCPADCTRTQMLNPHAVGDQEIVYRSLVVGGPVDYQTGYEGIIENSAVYRGDSFVCASAVHSGLISNTEGGCGVLTFTGEQPAFTSSEAHRIESIGFDSYFPLSFGFLSGSRAQCRDLRWPALLVSVCFSAVLSIFTTSPPVFFWSIFTGLFFHVALASDPPYASSFYGLLSTAFGRFLPAAFCGAVMYRYAIKRSLTGLTAQFEKTVLWLGAAWVGALNNYTFDRIPIQRLTPHDIKAQPGAVPALVIVILSILSIALGQAWAFRVEGRMPKYLLLYGLLVAGLLLMIALPGVNLRIHHYILGLLFLPGTGFQNRPSLLYQGLLVGLFVNGIARWGFDSIIQTPAELLRGVHQGSLLPSVSVLAAGPHNITFDLGPLPVADPHADAQYDGLSVLVNDVERFHGYADSRDDWDVPAAEQRGAASANHTWTWTRHRAGRDAAGDLAHLPEYFRFAYLAGSAVADYTRAGRWDQDGRWREKEPGPSRKRDVEQNLAFLPWRA